MFFYVIRGYFLGSSGNHPLRALSANSEALSLLDEKKNLFGLTDRKTLFQKGF